MFTVKLWDENNIPCFLEGADTPNEMECHLLPREERARPAVIVLPGGAYVHRAPHEAAPIAQFYNSRGFQGFVCHYRVAPNRYPAELMDAQRAIRLVRKNAAEWHVDPDRVFVIGFSAGGHLASLCATSEDVSAIGDELDAFSPKPNGAILSYALISLADDFGHVYSGKSLLGEAYEEKKYLYSTQNMVNDKTCPCFIWHTAEDGAVQIGNPLAFIAALDRYKIPFEVHIFPHGHHGLGLAYDYADVREWAPLSADWIDRNFPENAQ